MPEQPRAPATISKDRREQTIRTLVSGFAEDRLTLEELERRLDVAHRTLDASELDRLVSDLPVTTTGAAPPTPAAPPSATREHQFAIAIMGGVVKKGRWTPARRTTVLAFMGGAEIDLREAILSAGETEIAVFTVWGGVEIVVPPGVNVDVSGVAIMGGFEQHRDASSPVTGGPTVRVTGFALMAGVEVFVRYPGESAKDARRRMREERRSRGRGHPPE